METTTTCGCCSGTDPSTPVGIDNRPGLSAIAYRMGRHPDFKQSLLARFSSADLPALAGLQTRDNSDFTIALSDAFAMMADVLTFYQERIANENYLRTALERRSVLELAALIGYELAPGVAAGTHLAFTLEDAPGARDQAARRVDIPPGTKVQSVPGPNEQPVTFETVETIEARWQWNAIGAQTSEPAVLRHGDLDIYLRGTDFTLRPGDVLLLVGRERLDDPTSERWDARMLKTVEPVRDTGYTRVTWLEGLGHVAPTVQPAAENVRAYVFRLRASLFGHNAPDPRMFNTTNTKIGNLLSGDDWKDFAIQNKVIDLDSAYPTVAPDSWVLLVTQAGPHRPSSFPGYKELYRAGRVSFLSRSAFGLSGRVTRITPDGTENLAKFGLRDTSVFAESEPLVIADRPVLYPVYGEVLALNRLVPELTRGRPVAIAGKGLRVRVTGARNAPVLVSAGGVSVALAEGDELSVVARPAKVIGGTATALAPEQLLTALASSPVITLRWRLRDRNGFVGDLDIASDQLALLPAAKDDPTITEIAMIADTPVGVVSDRDRTTLTFTAPLVHIYERTSVVVNANVAAATHGETVQEVLGSGDAGACDQRFVLKQPPLTYVSAPTASGRASTLEVRVNDLLWTEVPTLYGHGPRDRVYETFIDDSAVTTVQFGDDEGARLPTGVENIRAKYRRGLGAVGNVRRGQLTTLLGGVLGVKGASNPEPATGGEDPERLDDARRNAPISALTLERIVSRRDYEDYARGYSGIAKAQALWIPWGSARGVFLTVAGPDGAPVPSNSDTYKNLLSSLRAFGDALLPLQVKSYALATFSLEASVKIDPAALATKVLEQVEIALRERFGFAAREFGQPVTIDEVIAVIHSVPSVIAVDVNALYRTEPGAPKDEKRLLAKPASVSPAGTMTPAQLLTLDPKPLVLGVMP